VAQEFKINKPKHGKTIEIEMKNPTVLMFEPGHPLNRMSHSSFRGVLATLRKLKPSPEKSIYADNGKGDLKRIVWNMHSDIRGQTKGASDKDKLIAEIEWIIGAMVPRLENSEEGPVKIPIEGMASHDMLTFAFNGHPLGFRDTDDLMVPRRLIQQEKEKLLGSMYLQVYCQEELSYLAAALLRQAGREAYPAALIGRKKLIDIDQGVAVFPDDKTLMTFLLHSNHPEISQIDLFSDPAAESMIKLRSAENRLRRELFRLAMGEIHGVEGESLSFIKRRMKQAKSAWPENPRLADFSSEIEKIEKKEVEMDNAQKELKQEIGHATEASEMVGKLMEDVTDSGVAKKIRLIGKNKGMKPEEIEQRMSEIFDKLEEGFELHGSECVPLRMVLNAIEQTALGELKDLGLPTESFRKIKVQLKALNKKNREAERTKDKPDQIQIPQKEETRDDDKTQAIHLGDYLAAEKINAKLEKLLKRIISSGGIARKVSSGLTTGLDPKKVMSTSYEMIDLLAQGFKDHGLNSKPLLAAYYAIKHQFVNDLIEFGLSEENGMRIRKRLDKSTSEMAAPSGDEILSVQVNHLLSTFLQNLQGNRIRTGDNPDGLAAEVVEQKIKEMMDLVAAGVRQYGKCDSLVEVINSLGKTINQDLPKHGFPKASVNKLKRYFAPVIKQIAQSN
jgi:hypothetical protein